MAITFEDIKKANETIIPTKIDKTNKKTGKVESKDYAEVNQRLKAFRIVFPTGTIATEMLSCKDGVCVFKASVYADSDPTTNSLLATGHAFEREDASFINKTSYIENCETSAVGRALGMAGFGIDVSIASYEEVANAMANQEKQEEQQVFPSTSKLLNIDQKAVLIKKFNEKGLTKEEDRLKYLPEGRKSIDLLTESDYQTLMDWFNKKKQE